MSFDRDNVAFEEGSHTIVVTLIILKAGFSLIKKSYDDLIDCSLSEEERKEIEEVA